MASELEDFDKNVENLKATVRKSFARIYAALKARELKTLRQLDALRKQCHNDNEATRNCIKNVQINFNNESTILENVSNYGAIDFEKINFDSCTFTLEDYVSPNDDHMYCYKTIEDLTKEEDSRELEAIEEAALKEITKNDNCVCYVEIRTEDLSKKFRNFDAIAPDKVQCEQKCLNTENECPPIIETNDNESVERIEGEENNISDEEQKKIDPTDDWLNSIKNQTETEPSQVTDVMEHSKINCT